MITNRRHFLRRMAGGVALLSAPLQAAMLTPRQSAGPFYPDLPLLEDDSDLTRVPGSEAVAKGRIADLGGRLLDRNGAPIAGTRIEIWQCDANGRYRHSRDPGQREIDPGFQGLGHAVSDGDGLYRFRTIRPVPYPGRTPHIHVAVFPSGEKPFVTQLYVEGEQRNADDFLYQHILQEQRHLVTVPFADKGASLPLEARWDIVLGVA